MTVVNAGDTSGALTLSQADRVDSPTPAGPLSGVLDLTVTDLTAGRTVFAGKLAALLTAAARRRGRGGEVQAKLTCQAACRARFTATARAGGASARLRAVTRTLRRPGRVVVRVALPRRTRASLAARRRASVKVSVRVSIDGRSLVIRKTVRLTSARKRQHA